MSAGLRLRVVPEKFLDQQKWTQVRNFTSSELEALCSLNAPYPDSAEEFFWRGGGSDPDARRCYRLGKSLVEKCRALFMAGHLVASGENRNGVRRLIPKSWWVDLYPMFAIDRVEGRSRRFENVEVCHGDVTAAEKMLYECIAWLKQRRSEGAFLKGKLEAEALELFGPQFALRIFNTSYKAVFDFKRGRPLNH
jgi:hypothetical protein